MNFWWDSSSNTTSRRAKHTKSVQYYFKRCRAYLAPSLHQVCLKKVMKCAVWFSLEPQALPVGRKGLSSSWATADRFLKVPFSFSFLHLMPSRSWLNLLFLHTAFLLACYAVPSGSVLFALWKETVSVCQFIQINFFFIFHPSRQMQKTSLFKQ